MDQPQAKPHRRRRWLIVTVVLVLLASVSWWYWPRGDARFVGRWAWHFGNSDPSVLNLVNDGTGWLTRYDIREFVRWRFERDSLFLEFDAEQGISSVLGTVLQKFNKQVRAESEARTRQYLVTKLDADEIHFVRMVRGKQRADSQFLVRIPE